MAFFGWGMIALLIVIAVVLSGVNVFFAEAPGVAVTVHVLGMALLCVLSRTTSKHFLNGPFATIRWAGAFRRAMLSGALGCGVVSGAVLVLNRSVGAWVVVVVVGVCAGVSLTVDSRWCVGCCSAWRGRTSDTGGSAASAGAQLDPARLCPPGALQGARRRW